MIEPRYTPDELARLGDAMFEREVAARVCGEDPRHFVAIDVESGAYEVDRNESLTIQRLLERRPDAQLWLRRVGSRYAHRFGPRAQAVPGRPA